MNIEQKILPKSMMIMSSLLALLLSTTSLTAASRIFNLHLQNNDMTTSSKGFKLSTKHHNCYEGTPRLGHRFNIASGGTATIKLARVQGHGCNGEQGKFAIEIDGERELVHFNFNNGGVLAMTTSALGTLSTKNGRDESYIWSSVLKKKIVIDKPLGKAQAYWEEVCNKPCTVSNSVTVTKGNSEEKVTNQEETNSIAKSLTIGVEFPYGVSAEMSVSTENSSTVGQSFSRAVTYERSSTNSRDITYSPDDFNRFGIESIWRWVARVKMQSGKIIFVKTKKYTCTANGKRPTYFPGSSKDVGSCTTEVEKELSARELAELKLAELKVLEMQKKLGLSTQKSTPATTTVLSNPQRVASQGSSVDVTAFTLINDSATAIKIRWINGEGKDHGNAKSTSWTRAGESWIIANGAKTWESHWFGVHTPSGFLCSISPRQGKTVKLSQLLGCKR